MVDYTENILLMKGKTKMENENMVTEINETESEIMTDELVNSESGLGLGLGLIGTIVGAAVYKYAIKPIITKNKKKKKATADDEESETNTVVIAKTE